MTQYVIENDDYLASGYVDASYVGTDSDLYVEAGYVLGVVLGTATLASSASQSATIGKLNDGTATIDASATISASGSKTSNATIDISGALSFGVAANLTLV